MISIIVPIFNAENALKRMLDSILNQSDQKFECILIDDGSSDLSYHICKEYAKKDSRIRCFTQDNHGVSYTRNRGIEVSRGQFITFLDADDLIPPNYLNELVTCCEKADIAVCDVVIETEEGKSLSRFTAGVQTLTSQQALNRLLTRKEINSGPYGKLFRRSVVEGLRFPALKAYEDILFVKDAFARSNYIVSTAKTAYHYRQNAGSTMDHLKRSPSLDVVSATEELLKFISQHKDLDAACLYITISHLYQYVLALDVHDDAAKTFRDAVRQLYRNYWTSILSCSAFPWKEKIVYSLFAWNRF